jgi:uncharacterized membrane protein YsdA (DUF1294 family)
MPARLTLTETLLRWGASLAGLWLLGAAAALAAWSYLDRATSLFLTASLFLSTVTWLCFLYDKRQAALQNRRIRESTLHALTLLGGWAGAFLAQRWLRHKSQEISFQLTAWCGLVLHALAFLTCVIWL